MISILLDDIEYRFFDQLYAVSRCGKVLRKLKPYQPKIRSDGYVAIGRMRLLHRMVATIWLEKPEGSTMVHHIDHDKANNHADNLEWTTQKVHMGERHKGCHGNHYWPESSRERLRQFRTGRKDSPTTRERKREILDAVCPKRGCEIDGITYRSVRQASIKLGVHVSSLRWRLLSKNFPNYKLFQKT